MSLKDQEDAEKCPHCGKQLEKCYGLAGGGIGPYTFCPVHGVIDKWQDLEMQDEKATTLL